MPRPRTARRTAAAALVATALAGCATVADRTADPADEPRTVPAACEHRGAHDINGDGYADAVVSEGGRGVVLGAIRVLYGTPQG